MRIHLGHHFYGAGNLGDDFMLGGFLAAMVLAAPEATFSLATPFPLGSMRRRFPQINWLDYTPEQRRAAIATCDAWVGLGGSPFQSAQSRWFVDHLVEEAAGCRAARKPMYFLGVGVQDEAELRVPEVGVVCAQAAGIWTRDAASASRLAQFTRAGAARAAADLAHLLFSQRTQPPVVPRSATVAVALNFDHRHELGAGPVVAAVNALSPAERVWLVQESRPLAGAEKDLFRRLSADQQRGWVLVEPDQPGKSLEGALDRWPDTEWLVTSRFHAAIAGAWQGARVLVLTTNEKLRGVAEELGLGSVPADADAATIGQALRATLPARPPAELAARAKRSVEELVTAIRDGAGRG